MFIFSSSASHGLYNSPEKQLKHADADGFSFFFFSSVSYFDDCYLLNVVNMMTTPIQFPTLKKKSILFGLVKIILGYQNPKSACLKGYQGFFNFANPGMDDIFAILT